MKRNYAQSVYFCPNERINISTSSSRSFQFVRLPSNDTFGFDFLVKGLFLFFMIFLFNVYVCKLDLSFFEINYFCIEVFFVPASPKSRCLHFNLKFPQTGKPTY